MRCRAQLKAQLAQCEVELEGHYEMAPMSPIQLLSHDSIHVLQQSTTCNEALMHEVAGLVQKVRDTM